MKFLRYLNRHYNERGYDVYSRHLSHLLAVPSGWKGPLPDMLVEKGEQGIAIFLVTSDTLCDSVAHTAWRGAIEDNAVSVKIFVSQKKDLSLLELVLQQENIVAETALLKRERYRSLKRHFSSRRVTRTILSLSLALLVALLLLWIISHLYDYEIEFYEPRDLERETM